MKNTYARKCEYFCNHCGKLSGSMDENPGECFNCHSTDIIIGEPETLDFKKLREKFEDAKVQNQ